MNITIEDLKNQLDRIEKATNVAAKKVLNIEEVSFMTGFKKATLYEMSSKSEIPHSKKGGRLFFRKEEIEDWLLKDKVATNDQINKMASAYITKKRIL